MDLVNLAVIGDRLNKQFSRHLDEPISPLTPYDWWKRTKKGTITEPMPNPVSFINGRPVFRYADVMRWFIRYRGIGR